MKDILVVAPSRHVEMISEVTQDEWLAVFELARELSCDLETEPDVERVYLVAAGDVVPHFHVHLIPRRAGMIPLGPFVFGATGWKGQLT